MVTLTDFKRFLRSKNFTFDENEYGVVFRERAENSNDVFLVVVEVTDDGYAHIHLRTYSLGKYINDNLKGVINSLNAKWNFFKFFYLENKDDGSYDLYINASAIVKENDSCDEIMELIFRSITVANEIYSEIQRAIWR